MAFIIWLYPFVNRVTAYSLGALANLTKSGPYDHRTVFLIDKAHHTYREPEVCNDFFKDQPARTSQYFGLVCKYGSADEEFVMHGDTSSEASKTPVVRRVELHSTIPVQPQMLLSPEMTQNMVNVWGKFHGIKVLDGMLQYIQFETQGHVGMVTRLLRHLNTASQNVMSLCQCEIMS